MAHRGMTYRRAETSSTRYDPARHLWVVVSDPAAGTALVVTVSLSSVKGGPTDDSTCLIAVGEHPFVVKPSFVFYRGVRVVPESELDAAFRRGLLVVEPDMAPGSCSGSSAGC